MGFSCPSLPAGAALYGIVAVAALLVAGVPAYPQTDTIPPNENLLAEGIPAVPAALASSVARYTNYRTATFGGWDPVRREMLISTRFADVPQLHLVKFPGGDRSQLTFYPDPVISSSFHPTKGDYFIFIKDTGGGEFFQIYRQDLVTGEATLLTDGKSRNLGYVWAEDGSKIAYGSTRRDGSDVDIWVMDPAEPRTDRMVAKLEGGGWQALDWSPDGRTLLVENYVSAEESYLYVVDEASGERKLLTPKGAANVHYGSGRFSKDGRGIFATTDRDCEFQRLAYIDLATLGHTYLSTAIPWDIDEFDLSDNGRTIAFVANEDGFGVLHLLDTASGKEMPVPEIPKGVVSGVTWHRNSRDIAFDLSSARTGGDVYSLDVESGRVERWTTSETGGLNTALLPEPELIHWKSWDGRTISGFLFIPPATFTGKRPVIVAVHGGPESQDRPRFLGAYNYWLNELGIAVVFPNVRGSTGYGKTFLSLDDGFLREGSYRDIDTLLDWIHAQPGLEPERVMVTGGS